jgi:hypothetical protein
VILLVNYQKTSKASFDIKRNYTSKDALIQVCLYLGLYFGLSALKSRGKNDKKIERIYNVGKRVNKMEDLEKENKVPETHKKGIITNTVFAALCLPYTAYQYFAINIGAFDTNEVCKNTSSVSSDSAVSSLVSSVTSSSSASAVDPIACGFGVGLALSLFLVFLFFFMVLGAIWSIIGEVMCWTKLKNSSDQNMKTLNYVDAGIYLLCLIGIIVRFILLKVGIY